MISTPNMGNQSSSTSSPTIITNTRSSATVTAPNTNIVQPKIDTTITVSPNLSNSNVVNVNPNFVNPEFDNDKTVYLKIGLASIVSGAMAYSLGEDPFLFGSAGGVTNAVRELYYKKNLGLSYGLSNAPLDFSTHYIPIAGGTALSFYGASSHDITTFVKSLAIISTGCISSDLI